MYKDVVDFIREIYKTDGDIPLHEPRFWGNEKKYVAETIDTNFVSSVGKFVDQFEHMMAGFVGAKYAVATVNGTAALHVSLSLVGVKAGDEVITQPLTFVATCNAIKYCGAKPVFIDVDKETMGLSALKLEQWLDEYAEIRNGLCYNKDTGAVIRACVPMHTFGHPLMIEGVRDICARYHIALIEDAAEALGSYYKDRHVGTFGEIGVFSFNGNKIVTTGGGGMLVTDNEKIARRAKHITTTAKVSHRWEYIHDEIAYNYRMPNLNAALGCAQLEQLPDFLKKKRVLANKYKMFFDKKLITFFSEQPGVKSNYWLNALLLRDRNEKEAFLKFTNDHGIMTRSIWRLMSRLDVFKDCQVANVDNAIWLEDRVVNIPSSAIA